MKQLLLALAALVPLSAPAMAGPGQDLADFASDLREEAHARAQRLAARPASPADVIDIEDPFAFELEQFAADSLRLSRAIESSGGPSDLRCIFRGISQDANRRLEGLQSAQTGGEQARLYRSLVELMRDAEDIAPSVDTEADLPATSRVRNCGG